MSNKVEFFHQSFTVTGIDVTVDNFDWRKLLRGFFLLKKVSRLGDYSFPAHNFYYSKLKHSFAQIVRSRVCCSIQFGNEIAEKTTREKSDSNRNKCNSYLVITFCAKLSENFRCENIFFSFFANDEVEAERMLSLSSKDWYRIANESNRDEKIHLNFLQLPKVNQIMTRKKPLLLQKDSWG